MSKLSFCPFTTSKHYHSWRIRSLNVITTSLSRNYLERWRFLRFVKNLVKAHPKVPQKHITPYFIMRAMQARYTEGADHHRHVFDEQLDSDVDENGDTTLPRSLRHVSSSEVYSIMATHCQWFLAQQLVTHSSHHTHVNLKLWYAFCKEVAQAMKKNKALGRNGRKSWGKPYQPEKKGNETSSRQQNEKKADSLIDLKPFGMVDGGWERRIRKRCIVSLEISLYPLHQYPFPLLLRTSSIHRTLILRLKTTLKTMLKWR